MSSNQEYEKIKSSKVPKFLRDSPVLDLSEKYVFIPSDKYFKSLEVKSIEDYIKVFNAMDYFHLNFSEFLEEFEMNNSEEVLAYLLQIRELPHARERIDLIQKNILRSKTFYTGVVLSRQHGESGTLFDTGIFDTMKDCIDSLIIYLMSRKILIDENWGAYQGLPGEYLGSMILEILGKKKSDEKIDSLNSDIKRIDFLIKHVKTQEDLRKVCERFSYYYGTDDEDFNWSIDIFERNIGSVYLKPWSKKFDYKIENKDIVYAKELEGYGKYMVDDSDSDYYSDSD